jgi:hypothetical protein
MDKKQKEIILELKVISKQLGHTIKRRDSNYRLYQECLTHFGSFNKAKEIAGLETKNNHIRQFHKNAFIQDKDFARIASYLTFDGHIYKNLRAFYFCSKDINQLKEFEKIINRKFGINGKYYFNNGGAFEVKTHKFIIFNKIIAEELVKAGIPKGEKVSQSFSVPKWILSSKELSKEYLKIAFLCEGCLEKRKKSRIAINIAKIEDYLEDGIHFMNELKNMLYYFDIKTTPVYLSGKRIRKKDGKLSKDIRFRLITSDSNKFINKIGWLK